MYILINQKSAYCLYPVYLKQWLKFHLLWCYLSYKSLFTVHLVIISYLKNTPWERTRSGKYLCFFILIGLKSFDHPVQYIYWQTFTHHNHFSVNGLLLVLTSPAKELPKEFIEINNDYSYYHWNPHRTVWY